MNSPDVVPLVPGALPGIGHAHRFARDPIAFLDAAHGKLGNHFRFKLAGREVHALISPDGHRAFFGAPDACLSQKEAYKFTVPIFGRGVAYDVDPATFNAHLEKMHLLLQSRAMRHHVDICVDETCRFAATLGERGTFELRPVMDELISRIVCRCFIGDDLEPVLDELGMLFDHLEGGVNPIAMIARWFPSPANLRRDWARRRIGKLLAPLIRRRKERPTGAGDFLSALIELSAKDASFTDEQIIGVIVTLIFSARSTASAMTTACGLALLSHSLLREDLLKEAREVIGSSPLDAEGLRGLASFERFLKEVERVYPPLPLLMRTACSELKVGQRSVPKGAMVMVSPVLAHRLPSVFREPNLFDPGRFAAGRQEDRATPGALIGFGGGRHRCLGYHFAHQVGKVVWTILPSLFELAPEHPIDSGKPRFSMMIELPPTSVVYRRRVEPVMSTRRGWR